MSAISAPRGARRGEAASIDSGRGNKGKGGGRGEAARGDGGRGHRKGRGNGEAAGRGNQGKGKGRGNGGNGKVGGRGEAARPPSSKHRDSRGHHTPGKGQGDRCESPEAVPEGSVEPPSPTGEPLDEPARRAALHARLAHLSCEPCEPELPALPAHPWKVMPALQAPSPTELRLATSLPAEERAMLAMSLRRWCSYIKTVRG